MEFFQKTLRTTRMMKPEQSRKKRKRSTKRATETLLFMLSSVHRLEV